VASRIQRINISFPKKVADDLASLIPPGKRSHVIVDATRKELQKVKILRALERAAGAWTDANHPELKTIEDVRTWVRHLRKADRERMIRLSGRK
jgi:metal-responsive CopG/Arc/MetJ family transcriptional regulator